MEKSLPSYPREPFFNVKKRPLCLQTMAFTPLSIRRGVGGEALDDRSEAFLICEISNKNTTQKLYF